MRMSRHEKAIHDEIAELEKEIESLEARKDEFERRRQSACAQRAMLLNLLDKAKAAPGDPGDGAG